MFDPSAGLDLDQLRDRLKRFSDAELLRFGKAARYMCSPEAQPFGGKQKTCSWSNCKNRARMAKAEGRDYRPVGLLEPPRLVFGGLSKRGDCLLDER